MPTKKITVVYSDCRWAVYVGGLLRKEDKNLRYGICLMGTLEAIADGEGISVASLRMDEEWIADLDGDDLPDHINDVRAAKS